jgi:hypothetical protein
MVGENDDAVEFRFELSSGRVRIGRLKAVRCVDSLWQAIVVCCNGRDVGEVQSKKLSLAVVAKHFA